MAGVNAELVSEFAKDKVWEESKEVFNNQIYIFGKQYFRISRCLEKVDVIVTDSPILLSLFYNKDENIKQELNDLVLKVFKSLDTFDYLLTRDKPYNSKGRFQTQEESDALAEPMRNFLKENWVVFWELKGNKESYDFIVKSIFEHLELKKMGAFS